MADKTWFTVSHRDARFAHAIVGVDLDPAMAGVDRVRASYGSNYKRLAQIKARYDPGNLFHINQNIQPFS